MKNSMKKLVTLGLTATMILGSTFTVFADPAPGDEGVAVDKSGTGTSYYINMNVYKITLPTDAVITNALSYVADPQGLVEATDAEEFGDDVTIGEANGVYFKTVDEDGAISISGTSESYEITNKSSRGVQLAIEAKLTEAASDKYAGGYSTTADFSGTGDDATGLYLGVKGTNEVKATALTATKADIANVAFTAGDQYEVSYDNTTKYSYALKADAKDFPTYKFAVTGALNPDKKDSWAKKDNDGKLTGVLAAPAINIKFTPTLITANEATAIVEGDDIYIQKVDATENGGFGTTKPASLKVNGKTVSTVSDNVDGFVTVKWDDVCKAYGFANGTAEGADDCWKIDKTIEFTIGSGASAVDYCADIPVSMFK